MSNRLWVKRKQGRDRGLRWEVSDVRWKTSVGLVIVGWNPCLTEGTQIPDAMWLANGIFSQSKNYQLIAMKVSFLLMQQHLSIDIVVPHRYPQGCCSPKVTKALDVQMSKEQSLIGF